MAGRQGGGTRKVEMRARPEPAEGEAPLSPDRIAAAAIDILDADGVAGLSMRRLADRLGCGAMSLYWHVANKEAVFDLALDTVLAYEPPPAAPGDWRDEIRVVLEGWRAAMLRHPWSASLLPRRALGPSILARLESLARALARGGVAGPDLNVAIWSLWNYVMGATVTRASFGPSESGETASRRRIPDPLAAFPTIARARLLDDDDWDGTFRKGLAFLLEGLTRRR